MRISFGLLCIIFGPIVTRSGIYSSQLLGIRIVFGMNFIDFGIAFTYHFRVTVARPVIN